jgi:hypothetical protein
MNIAPLARYVLRTVAAAAAVMAFLTVTAGAQGNPMMPHFSLGKDEKRKLTPEEQQQQDQLDSAYDAAKKKIPDAKAPPDPWADVRSAPSSASQSKQQ